MQELAAVAALLREVSVGILVVGLFYTFGMFILGRVFSVMSDHGTEHDVEKDYDHGADHGVEKDYDMDHDVDHDVDHAYDHGVEHEIEHDTDHDVDHDVEKEFHHPVDHDVGSHVEHEHDYKEGFDPGVITETESHSGFFETKGGAPLGVTIGTSLVSFGFIGSVVYYEGLLWPFFAKLGFHLIGVFLVVYGVHTFLGRVFVESGFLIRPRHIVGRKVEAATTIRDDFGEVRLETEMGLRRFHARSLKKDIVYEKGTPLYIVSANEKLVYVDSREEVAKGQSKQSGRKKDRNSEIAA
ncbi:MAG: hypothetical protein JSW61_02490 [Candidatus Thorarchaeota archaeon]|nr:MAG: hypothetical protein JSW61_02490 [Candidatus Thorarchaeota archaeon]